VDAASGSGPAITRAVSGKEILLALRRNGQGFPYRELSGSMVETNAKKVHCRLPMI
jgi:hypothetical protein